MYRNKKSVVILTLHVVIVEWRCLSIPANKAIRSHNKVVHDYLDFLFSINQPRSSSPMAHLGRTICRVEMEGDSNLEPQKRTTLCPLHHAILPLPICIY